MTVKTEWVTLTVENSPMETYVAKPEGKGPWPGILVFMEIFGVNSHIRDVTERIAAEGYVAMAMNYYHRTTPNLELGYNEEGFQIGRKHKDQTTREGVIADIRASVVYLKESPDVSPNDRFGCIGFCYGGHVAYIAATLPEIKATASFYGGGIATTSPGGGEPTVKHTSEIHGEIICFFGEQDPLIPKEDMDTIADALKRSGIQHDVVRYSDAGHGFFCDQRPDYNQNDAKDAWHRSLELFSRNLKGIKA